MEDLFSKNLNKISKQKKYTNTESLELVYYKEGF